MTDDDLMRNLGIARSQLLALRRDPSAADGPARIDAVLHVLAMVAKIVRDWHAAQGSQIAEPPDDGQLELRGEAW